MRDKGSSAIKAILAMGILAFLLLAIMSVGMKQISKATTARIAKVDTPQSPFDKARAFKDLETIVGFGPRPSGSEALVKLQGFIKKNLAQAGLRVWQQDFEADTPIGKLPMLNIVGEVKGNEPGIIILGTHYETKYLPDVNHVGANDGGSGTAWMLEMARILGGKRDGRTLWLCFFDGQDALEEWSATDSLYGSRAFVRFLREKDRLGEIDGMLNFNMIGDAYLSIKRDRSAPEEFVKVIYRQAGSLGYRAYFQLLPIDLDDDHLPFRQAGIAAVNVLDFTYGLTKAHHAQNWHTANDTLERVSPDSLQVVGDVIYHALSSIDAYLDAAGRRPVAPEKRERS